MTWLQDTQRLACKHWVTRPTMHLCAARMCLCGARRARAAEEGWSFAKMATQAYMDRVDLSAHGFYATPEITGVPGPSNCCFFGVVQRQST